MLKLKKPRKSRQQPQNVEPEQTEDLNTAQVRLVLLYDSIDILLHSTKYFKNFQATAKMSRQVSVCLAAEGV